MFPAGSTTGWLIPLLPVSADGSGNEPTRLPDRV